MLERARMGPNTIGGMLCFCAVGVGGGGRRVVVIVHVLEARSNARKARRRTAVRTLTHFGFRIFFKSSRTERRERERNQTAAARTSMSDYGTELLRRQLAGEHFAGEVWSGPPAPAISQQHKGPGPGPGTLPQPGPFVIACRQYADICPIIMARLIHRPFHFLFSLSIMPPQNSTRTRSIWCRWG